MPELPDVEVFRRYLARHAQGQRIERLVALDPVLIRNSRPQALGHALKGSRFATPSRHGKWLIAPVGQVELLIHFGMTGQLRWAPNDADRHRHDRLIFVCEGGELRYNNMRRFGGLWLVRDEEKAPPGHRSARARRRRTRRRDVRAPARAAPRRRQGSAHGSAADRRDREPALRPITWRACIHPATPVARLGSAARRRLYEALRGAVRESIRYGRIPRGERWLTRVRDDPRAHCPRCGTLLRRTTIAGRTACWCPRCQRPRA